MSLLPVLNYLKVFGEAYPERPSPPHFQPQGELIPLHTTETPRFHSAATLIEMGNAKYFCLLSPSPT